MLLTTTHDELGIDLVIGGQGSAVALYVGVTGGHVGADVTGCILERAVDLARVLRSCIGGAYHGAGLLVVHDRHAEFVDIDVAADANFAFVLHIDFCLDLLGQGCPCLIPVTAVISGGGA